MLRKSDQKKNGSSIESQVASGRTGKQSSIDPASSLLIPFFCWEVHLTSQNGIILHIDFMLSIWIVFCSWYLMYKLNSAFIVVWLP